MPKSKKSKLASKLGNKLNDAVSKHAGDEVNLGNVSLPGGIRNGEARLKAAYFDEYKSGPNQGEMFFRASGVVLSPDKAPDGTAVKGLTTSIILPICETTNSQGKTRSLEENVSIVLNEMRKLGVDTSDLSGEDLEDVAESLVEAAPVFRFSTSEGQKTPQFPNPRVWENWNGVISDYEESDDDDDIVDENNDDSAEDDSEDVPFGDDLDMLVDKAEKDDEEAQQVLTDKASEAGVGEAAEEAEDWAAVATLIREASGSEEDDEEVDEEWAPKKGETYKYKPPRKKNSVTCTVTTVFSGKKTCNLKDEDGNSHLRVAWDKLEEE